MLKFNSFPKHHARGKKAQAIGKVWESIFQNAAKKQGFVCIRIEDGCRSAYMKLIRVRQSFDFVLSFKGLPVAFIDTKTVKSANYTASMVTAHQVADLALLEANGSYAGYLVLFQKSNQVVWYSASQLKNLQARESLTPSDGILLGKESDFCLKMIFENSVK